MVECINLKHTTSTWTILILYDIKSVGYCKYLKALTFTLSGVRAQADDVRSVVWAQDATLMDFRSSVPIRPDWEQWAFFTFLPEIRYVLRPGENTQTHTHHQVPAVFVCISLVHCALTRVDNHQIDSSIISEQAHGLWRERVCVWNQVDMIGFYTRFFVRIKCADDAFIELNSTLPKLNVIFSKWQNENVHEGKYSCIHNTNIWDIHIDLNI